VNHFENHQCVSQKDQLFIGLQKTCEQSHKDVFDFLPITFVIDYSDQSSRTETILDKFTIFFNTIDKHKSSGLQQVNSALQTHPNLLKKSKVAT